VIETPWTKGQWAVGEAWGAKEGEPMTLCYHEINVGRRTILSTWAGPNLANATLAAGAPELYEALNGLWRWANACGLTGEPMDKAEAVMLKALGRAGGRNV
jgi:hypothetical protein